MAITIGLDFGTHQTKICIENSDSPSHKTYEFYEWQDGMYAFPSIIQINKDHTLRYGSIDMDSVLVARKLKFLSEPESLRLPPEPKAPNIPKISAPVLLPIPKHTYITPEGNIIEIPYNELYGIGKKLPTPQAINPIKSWKKRCKKIEIDYQNKLRKYMLYGISCGLPRPIKPVLPPKPEEKSITTKTEGIDSNLIATQEQKEEYKRWRVHNEQITKKYKELNDLNQNRINDYKLIYKEWMIECQRLTKNHAHRVQSFQESLVEYPMIFRYFKQATFSSYKWNFEINPRYLSVLYLSYIIFKLEERFGRNFSIQMGIPASKTTFNKLKRFAAGCLIQAIRLVEVVFQNNFERFLATPYEELLNLMPKYEYSDELKEQYGLIILPEAYAALRSLTTNTRIPRGMSIMLDMGGGTTDISFFVINNNKEPHVYHFESISKGLNFFLEYDDRHVLKATDFTQKKELEYIPNQTFKEAFREFKNNIDNEIKKLTTFLYNDTISRGFMKSAFTDAIRNRPAIYTGGGCYDSRMRKAIYDFSDVKYIDKNMLCISNIIDEKRVNIPYSLMATAYGLSIQRLDDIIEVSSKEDLFAQYSNMIEKSDRYDAYREHGMYED